ncbi:MAG: DUF4831 family protein [Lentimicrobiaceae bacterium]|nr:DUF4831 family protein [Lentimicrobiaceae bacterium]
MLKKSFSIFLILIVFQNLYSQKAVYQLPIASLTAITNPTFFYTLPKTAFKVDVVITKTSNIMGLYADFAEKLLGITNYCQQNTTEFHLKNVTIAHFTIPDAKFQFVAELSAEQIKSNFLKTLYKNEGAPDLQISSNFEHSLADILPDFFKNYADVVLQHTYETYTETKIVDGVVMQVPVTLKNITKKTLAQQAQEAVDFIEKVRADRYAILSLAQEVALEVEAFEYIVNQLNELEKKYLELFTGITVFEDICETVVVYPEKGSLILPVCSVVPNAGFSPSMNKTIAYNYYLKCKPQLETEQQTHFRETDASSLKSRKNNGYSIRKAVPTFVSLVHGDSEDLLGVFPIYQFGLLEILPPNLNSFEIGKWSYIY